MKITTRHLHRLARRVEEETAINPVLTSDLTGHRLYHQAVDGVLYPVHDDRMSTREMYFYLRGILAAPQEEK